VEGKNDFRFWAQALEALKIVVGSCASAGRSEVHANANLEFTEATIFVRTLGRHSPCLYHSRIAIPLKTGN